MVTIEVIAYTATDSVEEKNVTLSRCHELIAQYPKTWINIIGLDGKTATQLERLFNIHTLALEDCMDMGQRPKVEDYDDMLFIVTRTFEWEKKLSTAQLSIFLTKKYVITIHPKPLPQLEDVRNRIRKKFPRIIKGGSDYICFKILDVIVDSYIPELDKMGDALEKLEDEIIENPSKKTVEEIHDFRRDLLVLRKELSPEREALSILARGEYPHFNKETRNFLRDVNDHVIQVLDTLDAYRDSTADILSEYFSSMQLQLNEVMKLLTIIATIMLPLTLIASIYGMNFPIPETQHWISYPIILIIMILISISMLFYFRRKKWI